MTTPVKNPSYRAARVPVPPEIRKRLVARCAQYGSIRAAALSMGTSVRLLTDAISPGGVLMPDTLERFSHER